MFDGILKPKLYTKSKSHLKMTRTRLEAVRKKKSSVFKYLKNDVADLLRNGLDYNAYGRAEGLLIERNMLSCYDLINSFCETISNNLSLIYKQRECPEECREAVPSLMYAAARFADLPELRELRNLFSERYGNSLEVFMNEEFAEKLKTKSPSKEVKLQLLKEIAEEFSVEWNSKALEQRLYVPPPLEKPTSNFKDDGLDKSKGLVAKDVKVKEYTASEKRERTITSNGSQEVRDNDTVLGSSSGDEITEASSITIGSTDQNGTKGTSEEEEPDNQKPFYYRFIHPPYLKPKIDNQEREEPIKEKADLDEKEITNHRGDDSEKPKPRSVRRRNLKPPPGRENLDRIRSSESRSEAKEERNGKNCDEEERILDGLLMHYSKKQSTDESVKDETYLKPQRRRNVNPEAADSTPPARASSLPAESTSATDSRAKHARANSLEPEMVGHVHPKLPDYEELAARFAALKGK